MGDVLTSTPSGVKAGEETAKETNLYELVGVVAAYN